MLADLRYLLQSKAQFRVLPLEVHRQLAEAEAEAGVIPLAVRQQSTSLKRVVHRLGYTPCGSEKRLKLLT